MALYAVIIILSLACMLIMYMMCTNNLRAEYRRGWEDSKKFYYDDPQKEKELKEQRLAEFRQRQEKDLEKENSKTNNLTSELLMAYGVSNVGGLPKRVREAYNISEDQNNIDLDALIRAESNDTEV